MGARGETEQNEREQKKLWPLHFVSFVAPERIANQWHRLITEPEG
jgi:hypothetical protein